MIIQKAVPFYLRLDQVALGPDNTEACANREICAACGSSVENIKHVMVDCKTKHPDIRGHGKPLNSSGF